MSDREKIRKALERCLICDISVIASEEAQNAYRECEYTVGLYCGQKKVLRDALSLLEEQEAEWVEDKQDEHCRLIKCSKCGLTFIVSNNIPYDEWIEDRNYCRRCGARMRGMVKLE